MNTLRLIHILNSWIGIGPLNLAKNLQPSCWKTLKTLNFSPVLFSGSDDPYLSLVPCLTTDPGEWEILDNILSKSGAFPFLRRVEIRVNLCDHWWGDEFEDVVEEIEAIKTHHFLPWLRDHDSLVFIFEVTVSG